MSQPLISLVHFGEPVPASRPRFGGGRAYTPARYREYKRELAEHIRLTHAHLLDTVPPTTVPKLRRRYLRGTLLHLVLSVYRSKASGDWDNYAKCAQDALQDAGVIGNDSQVRSAAVFLKQDKQNPRIELDVWLDG